MLSIDMPTFNFQPLLSQLDSLKRPLPCHWVPASSPGPEIRWSLLSSRLLRVATISKLSILQRVVWSFNDMSSSPRGHNPQATQLSCHPNLLSQKSGVNLYILYLETSIQFKMGQTLKFLKSSIAMIAAFFQHPIRILLRTLFPQTWEIPHVNTTANTP